MILPRAVATSIRIHVLIQVKKCKGGRAERARGICTTLLSLTVPSIFYKTHIWALDRPVLTWLDDQQVQCHSMKSRSIALYPGQSSGILPTSTSCQDQRLIPGIFYVAGPVTFQLDPWRVTARGHPFGMITTRQSVRLSTGALMSWLKWMSEVARHTGWVWSGGFCCLPVRQYTNFVSGIASGCIYNYTPRPQWCIFYRCCLPSCQGYLVLQFLIW